PVGDGRVVVAGTASPWRLNGGLTTGARATRPRRPARSQLGGVVPRPFAARGPPLAASSRARRAAAAVVVRASLARALWHLRRGHHRARSRAAGGVRSTPTGTLRTPKRHRRRVRPPLRRHNDADPPRSIRPTRALHAQRRRTRTSAARSPTRALAPRMISRSPHLVCADAVAPDR